MTAPGGTAAAGTAPGGAAPGGTAAAGLAVEDYLARVSVRLGGPVRARGAIVAELRAGLLDAADAHRTAGLPAADAARAAVREFGDPAQVADGFGAELAARQARRTALALLATGPAVGLLWIMAAAAGHLGLRLALPWQQPGPAALGAGLCLVAVTISITGAGAAIGIAATGRLTRWLADRPRRAPAAAAVAGFGAVGADGLGLLLLTAELLAVPGRLPPLPAVAAAAASLARMWFARRAARRCLALRARMT